MISLDNVRDVFQWLTVLGLGATWIADHFALRERVALLELRITTLEDIE